MKCLSALSCAQSLLLVPTSGPHGGGTLPDRREAAALSACGMSAWPLDWLPVESPEIWEVTLWLEIGKSPREPG